MQGSQLEEFVPKKPGLHGGQVFFSPDAGRFTAPSMVSLQILGSIHLYMSWVWDTQQTKHENMADATTDSVTHTMSPHHLYLRKPNSYTRWLWLAGFKQWNLSLCMNSASTQHFLSILPFPLSHRDCVCRNSRCLYMVVSVCSSLNQPLEKNKPRQGKQPTGTRENTHHALRSSDKRLCSHISSKCSICMQITLHVCEATCKYSCKFKHIY